MAPAGATSQSARKPHTACGAGAAAVLVNYLETPCARAAPPTVMICISVRMGEKSSKIKPVRFIEFKCLEDPPCDRILYMRHIALL